MPVSISLRAFSLLTALAIASVALWPSLAATRTDPYSMTVKLAAGALTVIGSLCLSYAIGDTLLSGGGRGAFKALYWASFASTGAGIAEAASGFIAANVTLAVAMAALAFAGAGLLLLSYSGGG